MRKQRSSELRQTIAREAARLMYEEGVDQYFNAKRIAAKRLLGRVAGQKMRYRPQDLPSNGEIQLALREWVQLTEGEFNQHRLLAMRIIALETMNQLSPFHPRLIGSVSTGTVRPGSDIDIHVFTDHLAEVESYLHQQGRKFKTKEVTIRINSHQYRDYTHIYYEHIFPIELSVYPIFEIRNRSRSSTDGKPIVRLKPASLEKLIAEQHPNEWELYLATGEIEALQYFEF